MKINEYQQEALRTAIYPARGENISYPALGLTGEAGEVADKIKKIIRDQGGILTENNKVELAKELGDVMWYVASLAAELEYSLEEICEMNIEKLKGRTERGTLQGSGDNR